jgi:hypothetical protein
MSSPKPILRCQHIKVDGVQCGSPALRDNRRCYFHDRWNRVEANVKSGRSLGGNGLPPLEDANSIQLALAEVMQLAIMGHIEYRVFALLLRALRIASANLKHLSPTPEPTHIVIDPESVENRPLGATAWSETEGQDYDMIESPDDTSSKPEEAPPEMSADLADYYRLVAGVARDPDFLNKPYRSFEEEKEEERLEALKHEADRRQPEAKPAPDKWAGTIPWTPTRDNPGIKQEPITP